MTALLLDLFCGVGGASVGYSRAGFDVVGVDNRPQPNYPFRFHCADALEFLAEHGHEYAAIHASPPCQAYTCALSQAKRRNHPDLLRPTLAALGATGLPFVCENVPGAPWPTHIYRVMLCGSMFGLRMRRHRWFATNVPVLVPSCQHYLTRDLVGVYGASDGAHGPGFKHPGIRGGPRQATLDEAREVMRMPWAKRRVELTNAIPPDYAEYIGEFLQGAMNAHLMG